MAAVCVLYINGVRGGEYEKEIKVALVVNQVW